MKKQILEPLTERDKVLNALQKTLLEGLKEIDRICRKYDIKYSLGGGTCLGRVRHGGFIPWDDDIDIDMTLDNYNKFLSVAEKELDHNRFFLRCRDTDKRHLRTNSRLEIKFTSIETKIWAKAKVDAGIFIDIMSWTYLPNNKFLRKIVTSLLFYIRCIYNYKMFHGYARKGNPKLATTIVILSYIVPTKLLFFIENRLRHCCGNKKTDWIIDDSIINGNHGGFPSKGVDTYEDVYFEGIKVMDKKDANIFLTTLYGIHYMDWLPPVDRISHHQWTKVDLGVYSTFYDLPIDYKKYLTINYHQNNLEQMQKVSLDMMKDIDRICRKNNITYFVSDINAYVKLNEVDEYGTIFHEPFKIAMPRIDYDKFSKIAKEELGNKYFYQSTATDLGYKLNYANIRLNYTYIRDNNIPKRIEEKYHNGFLIKVIPLDNTSNDLRKRLKHAKKIRYLNHFINLKWKNYNLRYFLRKNIKIKLKMIFLLPFSLKYLQKKLNKITNIYNDIDTSYYVDSSSYQLSYNYIKKEILGKGKRMDYNGVELVFPEKKSEYLDVVNSSFELNKRYEYIKSLNYVKKNYKDSYLKMATTVTEEEINKIQKRYGSCFLNYYDIPEYQLSVLRYDEKNNKYLTNEEIIDYKRKEDTWKR